MTLLGDCNLCGLRGACCRFVLLAVHPVYMDADKRHWLELHGIKVAWRDGNAWATIESACRELTDEGLCGIYGQPERPQVCSDFPFTAEDIGIVNAWAGSEVCDYREEKLVPATLPVSSRATQKGNVNGSLSSL